MVGDWDGKVSDFKKIWKKKKIFRNKSEKGIPTFLTITVEFKFNIPYLGMIYWLVLSQTRTESSSGSGISPLPVKTAHFRVKAWLWYCSNTVFLIYSIVEIHYCLKAVFLKYSFAEVKYLWNTVGPLRDNNWQTPDFNKQKKQFNKKNLDLSIFLVLFVCCCLFVNTGNNLLILLYILFMK